jgi:hypothetical protein
MSDALEYFRCMVLKSRAGADEESLCSLVVGVPAYGRSAAEVAEVIGEALRQQEPAIRDRYFLRTGVKIPQDARIRFQVNQQRPYPPDYAGMRPDFATSDGKKFWAEQWRR